MAFTSWPWVHDLTIDHTKVGTGTHSRMPVRLWISSQALSADLRPDGRDLVVADSDGATQLNYVRRDYAADLHSQAVWSWYSGPRVIYDSTTNSTYATWAERSDIFVGRMDLTTGLWKPSIIRHGAGGDDHNHGCLQIASDGSILTVPLIHNDPSLVLYYSDGAGSVEGWTTVTIDGTANKVYNYPHLPITSDGKLHCFVRRAPSANADWRDIAVYSSTETSAPYVTWSSAAIILDASTSIQDFTYHKMVFDPATDTMYFVGGLYPGSIGSHSLYSFKATWNGSAWVAAKLDGTSITLPMTVLTAGTLAYTEVGSEAPWILDAGFAGGEVFALFNTFPDPDTDHRLWCVRTNSNVFQSRESIGGAIGGSIVPGTASNYYNGGAVFNPANPDEVLMSNGAGGTFEMQRWTASAGVWSKAADLTNYQIAGRMNIRPHYALGGESTALKAIWCEGTYTGYTSPNYDMQFLTYPRRVKPSCYIVVDVPNLSSSADRVLKLYAGNMTASDQGVATATVFESGTKLVAQGRNKRDDSTKILNDITDSDGAKALATRPIQAATALFVHSQKWGSTSSVTWPASDMNINSATGLTIYCLAKLSDLSADHAIADNVVDGTCAQFLMRVRGTSGLLYAGVMGIDALYGGNTSSLAMSAGTLYLVGLVYDGANQKVSAMLDGVLEQTASNAMLATLKTSGSPTTPQWGTYNSALVGFSEELVIETNVRSAAYLLTIKNILTNNAAFFAMGTRSANMIYGSYVALEAGIRGLNRGVS